MALPLTEEEQNIKIANVQHPKCVICTLSKLSSYDKQVFFRKLTYEDFVDEVSSLGYTIPEADFKKHANNHIYVLQGDKPLANMSSPDVLTFLTNNLRDQLEKMNSSGESDQPEYLKKMNLLTSLIELKGKFDGDFAKQKEEASDDFKTKMLAQIEKAMEANKMALPPKDSMAATLKKIESDLNAQPNKSQ